MTDKSITTTSINGWVYRIVDGHIERLNGWWQFPTWQVTKEEEKQIRKMLEAV
jgi:hypothetical protein